MKKIMLAVVIVSLVATSAMGYGYRYNTVFHNNESPFDYNNNWAPYSYPNSIGHLPSPGNYSEGGEKFDLEGFKVRESGNYVYVAMANSFGFLAHSTTFNQNYRLGDIFIGKDGGNPYQFAVDVRSSISNYSNQKSNEFGNTGFYRTNGSWNYIQNVYGSYYKNTTIRNAAGAHEIGSGAGKLGNIEFSKSFDNSFHETGFSGPGNGDTWVWEFKINRSLLGNFRTLDFHVNLGCGNDWMNTRYTAQAVPEPATLLLLGMGLMGAGIVRRRK